MMRVSGVAHDGPAVDFKVGSAGGIIGRGEEADLRIDHATVSRRHAELRPQPNGTWRLTDLESRNGLVVNGARVKSLPVHHGSQVALGSYLLTFALERETLPAVTMAGNAWSTSDSSGFEARALLDSEVRPASRERLLKIYRVSEQLRPLPDARSRHAALCSMLVGDLMNAFTAFIVQVREDSPEGPFVILGRAAGPVAPPRIHDYISRSLMEHVVRHPAPVMGVNSPHARGADLFLSIATTTVDILAMACRVRELRDGHFQVLYLTMPNDRTRSFGPEATDKLLELSIIADQLRSTEAEIERQQFELERARNQYEFEQAARIQQGLLPNPASLEPLGLALSFSPSRDVGGDYADVLTLPDGRLLLVLADVSGKGLHAAMVAAQLHSLVHAAARTGSDLPTTAALLDDYLRQHMRSEMFATAILARVDPATGRVDLVNAGHPPPVHYRAHPRPGEPRAHILDHGLNTVLGVTPQPFVAQSLDLAPGDRLLLYTDGLSELPRADGTLLNVQGVAELFARAAADAPPGDPGRADALAARVVRALALTQSEAQRGAAPADDQTFLVVKPIGPHPASPPNAP